MASVKSQMIFVSFMLVAIAVVINASNLVRGQHRYGENRVYYENINIHGRYNNIVSTMRIINVPKWNQTITYIRAWDRGFQGGYAKIIKGGVHQKNVTVLLTSPRSRPLNYTLEVFAQ